MKQLKYTATAKGQAGSMIILGRRVDRGETYNVTDAEAGALLLIGGFEEKRPKRRRKNADQEQE